MDASQRAQFNALRQLLPDCLLADQVRIGTHLQRAVRERRGLSLDRWLQQAQRSATARRDRGKVLQHVSYPEELPISSHRDLIVEAIRAHPVVVIAGETGSGKTTQIPKMCLEAVLGLRARVGCTQPRRVAAQAVSRRIAEELRVEWGREVGCKIRFSDRSSLETSIKMLTDGILLAEVQRDPLLAEYEAILIDEAHERSLNIDFLLGYPFASANNCVISYLVNRLYFSLLCLIILLIAITVLPVIPNARNQICFRFRNLDINKKPAVLPVLIFPSKDFAFADYFTFKSNCRYFQILS